MAGHKIPVALHILSALACSHGFSAPAEARLVKLEITAKQEYGTFRPGPFVHWQGRVVGELQPTEVIPDLDKAARTAVDASLRRSAPRAPCAGRARAANA